MKKHIILADPSLFDMYNISTIAIIGGSLWIIFYILNDSIKVADGQEILVLFTFLMFTVAWVAISIRVSNQWFLRLSFREERQLYREL